MGCVGLAVGCAVGCVGCRVGLILGLAEGVVVGLHVRSTCMHTQYNCKQMKSNEIEGLTILSTYLLH